MRIARLPHKTSLALSNALVAGARNTRFLRLGDLCAGVFTSVLICDSLNLNNGLRGAMSRRRIGQEKFGFAVDRGPHSSLDALARLIDWVPVDQALCVISCSAKGEPAWP